jgi:DNA-binding NarL/FixJ family response regulator
MDAVRVFILDDHDDVRHALAASLGSLPGLEVVGEAAEAEDGLRLITRLRPDVVLVETKRSDGRGLEIVSLIAQGGHGPCVIVLTSYLSEWEHWAVRRAGAIGYFLKEIGSPQLIACIRRVGDHSSDQQTALTT